jgi:hypothetical protein
MADLNALISQGAQFRIPPPVDPLGNMPQLLQMRAAQNQNALAQYQLSSAQRADVQGNALNTAYANSVDPTTGAIDYKKVLASLAGAGAGSQIPAAMKHQYDTEKGQTELRTAQTTLLKDKLALLPGAYQQADTPEAYAQLQNTIHADPVVGPWLNSIGATKEKGVAALQDALTKPNGFAQLRMGSMQSVKDILEGNKPLVVAAGSSVYNPQTQSFVGTAPEKTPSYAPSADQQGYDVSKAQGYKGTFLDYKKELALAGRTPAAAAAAQPPVAVVDPTTGKPVYVSREQAIAQGMTPASAQEGLPPKEIQQREAKYPQATAAIKTFESKTDSLATDLQKLANHPGLSGISGLIYGRTPAVTKEARAAQALYDSIVARGGFAELQSMRASSPTGGALGNVSNQEGEYLRNAFAPISRTQDTGDLKRALINAANVATASKQRMRDAYDMTYDYKTGGAPPSQAKPVSAPKEVNFGDLK